MTRNRLEFIHEGKYAAEVEIELRYSEESWSPTMSADNARRLDAVRSSAVTLPKRRSTVACLNRSPCRRKRIHPEGDDGSGEIVAWGTPEEIVKAPRSYTGQFLKGVLGRK